MPRSERTRSPPPSCPAAGTRFWAIWAACGYAVALIMLWRWGARTFALLVSVALAVLAPLLWLSVAYPLEDGMFVIDRSAALLLHHGLPYLSATQVTSWLSYNPYLPVMTLFGLPSAAGLGGLAGNSGVWIAIGTAVPLAAAFWIAMPARGADLPCPPGRARTGAVPCAAATRCWPPPSRWPRR